jgi:hypothetical protein
MCHPKAFQATKPARKACLGNNSVIFFCYAYKDDLENTMQHFMIPCDFGGRKAPFPIYVGEPKADAHPLQHQSSWLSAVRGGSIPQEVMDSFEKLHKIAMENNVSFEELCVYAMGEALATPENQGAAVAPPPAEPAQAYPPAQAAPITEPTQQSAENHQQRIEGEQQQYPVDPYSNKQS